MAQFDRHYTITEAQAMIPWVRRVFNAIHSAMDVLERPADPTVNLRGNPGVDVDSDVQKVMATGGPDPAELPTREIIRALNSEELKGLIQGLLQGLMREGIVIQDVQRGLIDFPAWAQSREVLLCYELGDGETLGHWHEVEAGFAGRQPLGEIE